MTAAVEPGTARDELAINAIRVLAMDAVQHAKSGHPGAPMGLAPLGYVLSTRVLRHDPANPAWPNRDRFLLSGGHASMLQYALLHLCGYDLPLEEIKRFRQWGSRTPGHPEYGVTPGVEATTGPLGQGVANAVGLALGERHLAARFNRGGEAIVDWRTYFTCGDGDMQEGVASEAASLAGNLALGKLIGVYDDNHVQIEGSTDLAFCEHVAQRFDAYGWHVQALHEEVTLEGIELALAEAAGVEDRPSLIVLRTHIGYGSPHKQDTAAAHGAPLGDEEVLLTKRALGWPWEEPFFVPDDAREAFAGVRERGAELEREWSARYERWAAREPELAADFERLVRADVLGTRDPAAPHETAGPGEPPAAPDEPTAEPASPKRSPSASAAAPGSPPGARAASPAPSPALAATTTPTFDPTNEKPLATRVASGRALNWIAGLVPELLGGAADLAPSTETKLDGEGDIMRGDFAGRNLHFGVREHAMGAIVNGLALTGLRPYGATFLVFSDYMRPPIRLAALMGIPSVFVFTHDSVGMGEDGPTHQPVEQLAGLHAIPGLDVIRPADLNETYQAWRATAEASGPTALVLSRQSLPVLDPGAVPPDGVARGAYVLREPDADELDAVLIGTGSEVSLCLAAAKLLTDDGIAARVVSMPCWERFARQPEEFRHSVIPPGIGPRLSVEAAAPLGWSQWVGERGASIGLDRFGASAPGPEVLKQLGFTPEAVAARARELIGR
jgi:transketolase